MYLNRVELIGFLGGEPEARSTQNGTAVTSLSLATKTSWLKGSERQERTEWHKIQVWGKLAHYAAGFKKGAHIRVQGELRSREYDTDSGTKVRTYEIVADSIINLRPDQRNNSQEPEPAEPPASEPPAERDSVAEAPSGKTRKRSRKVSREARS